MLAWSWYEIRSMPEPQTFDEAISLFQDFLRQNGYSANLAWVELAAVVLPGRREVYVKLPTTVQNLGRAHERFTLGVSKGVGVTFGTICELPNAACCYVWIPKDLLQQERHMVGSGLKLHFLTDRLPGIPVTNWLRWQVLKFRHRKRSQFKQVLFG